MNDQTTAKIPPPGERDDYICRPSHIQPGIWVLQRTIHNDAFQAAISSGSTIDQAMEKTGGVFYATGIYSNHSSTGISSNIIGFCS
jgi:hypothetical protein